MAGVAKWLRQWFVVPPFVGSSPIVRPHSKIYSVSDRAPVATSPMRFRNPKWGFKLWFLAFLSVHVDCVTSFSLGLPVSSKVGLYCSKTTVRLSN